MWLCLVISGICFGVYQSINIWYHYKTGPVVISIDKEYRKWDVNYPCITICQRDAIGTDYKFMNSTSIGIQYNLSGRMDQDTFKVYIRDILFKTYHNYDQLESYANGSKEDYLPPEMYAIIANLTNKVNPDVAKNGKPFRNPKNNHPYGIEKPIHYMLTEYGFCSVYNSEIAPYFDLEKNDTVELYPIVKKNYTQSSTFFSTKSIQSDYYVFLTSPNEIIDVGTEYKVLQKGLFGHVEIDVLSVVSDEALYQLSPEQRNCKFIHETEGLNYNTPVYSHKLCRMECRIALCMKYCNCIPYYYSKMSNLPVCNLAGMYCLSKYKEILVKLIDPKTKHEVCNCYSNCNVDRYSITSAETSKWFLDTGVQINLNIYPSERYKRSQIFTRTDVLAQVGGLFGLLLGCSILSCIELPYFIFMRSFWGVFGGRPIEPDL